MTLPTTPGRTPAIYKPAAVPPPDPAHGAAFIFLHGLGDSAEGLADVADQFQQNSKLPWMHWVFPNAMENKEVRATAWYQPTQFSDRPELQEPEDEKGMLDSVAYVESLIDACVSKGIPPQRIVLGGFSQGCAMALLTDLTSSKYAGHLAGIVGLMGYLPLCDRLPDLRAQSRSASNPWPRSCFPGQRQTRPARSEESVRSDFEGVAHGWRVGVLIGSQGVRGPGTLIEWRCAQGSQRLLGQSGAGSWFLLGG